MKNRDVFWTNKVHNFWINNNGSNELKKNTYHFNNPAYFSDPLLISTCVTSDFFDERADKWRKDAWEVIRFTQTHIWQIATKKPERILKCLPDDWGVNGYENVWLGVTVENQSAINRIHRLSTIPCQLRFINADPLLERVNFLKIDANGNRPIDKIDWVLLGGEVIYDTKGEEIRPTKLHWFEQCIFDLKRSTTAKVFVKQMGTYLGKNLGMKGVQGWEFAKFPKSCQVWEIPWFENE